MTANTAHVTAWQSESGYLIAIGDPGEARVRQLGWIARREAARNETPAPIEYLKALTLLRRINGDS